MILVRNIQRHWGTDECSPKSLGRKAIQPGMDILSGPQLFSWHYWEQLQISCTMESWHAGTHTSFTGPHCHSKNILDFIVIFFWASDNVIGHVSVRAQRHPNLTQQNVPQSTHMHWVPCSLSFWLEVFGMRSFRGGYSAIAEFPNMIHLPRIEAILRTNHVMVHTVPPSTSSWYINPIYTWLPSDCPFPVG